MNHDTTRHPDRYLNAKTGRLTPKELRLNAAMALLTRDTRATIARINADRDAAIAEAWLAHAEKASALTAAAYGPGA